MTYKLFLASEPHEEPRYDRWAEEDYQMAVSAIILKLKRLLWVAPIEALGMSDRAERAARRNHITTCGRLYQMLLSANTLGMAEKHIVAEWEAEFPSLNQLFERRPYE